MKYLTLFFCTGGLLLCLECKKGNIEKPEPLSPAQTALLRGMNSGPHHVIYVQNPGMLNDIQPAVQAAINSANNGDEIRLPEGVFSVVRTIVITKFISVSGSGMTSTILFRPESLSDTLLSADSLNCMFKFNINSTQPSGIFVSDLCLRSKSPCVTTGDGGSLAPDIGIKMISCTDFVIRRCLFQFFGSAAICVQHDDLVARGLVTSCMFSHNVKGPTGLGLGYGIVIFGANKQWITDPRFGSENFIFIENNTFDFHRHSVAAGGCALYVFRYNTVANNNIGAYSAQAIDAHEARQQSGLNYYSTRAVEIYNNTVVNTTFMDGTPIVPGQSSKNLVENAVMVRGGEALIHDNQFQGYRFGVGISNFVITGPQTYPIFTQPGYASGLAFGSNDTGIVNGHGDGDLFTWNNQFTPYIGTDTSGSFYNYLPQYFQQERDFHFVPKPQYQTYPYPHPHAGN